MSTKEEERGEMTATFEENEPGVADMMVLYERVEEVYVKASASTYDSPISYISDSTNLANFDANLG